MTTLETVKAWKDEEYRDALPVAKREKLPAHPAGVIEFELTQPDDALRFQPVNARTSKPVCNTSGVFCTAARNFCR
jgi:mersacidin/lichenicidin family type 2 lantibiotic